MAKLVEIYFLMRISARNDTWFYFYPVAIYFQWIFLTCNGLIYLAAMLPGDDLKYDVWSISAYLTWRWNVCSNMTSIHFIFMNKNHCNASECSCRTRRCSEDCFRPWCVRSFDFCLDIDKFTWNQLVMKFKVWLAFQECHIWSHYDHIRTIPLGWKQIWRNQLIEV